MDELKEMMQAKIDAAYAEGFLQGRLAAQQDYFGEVDTEEEPPKQVTMLFCFLLVVAVLAFVFALKEFIE